MNHFGYNARSPQVMCPNIPQAMKDKFATCNNIVSLRMSALELWDTRGPPVSAGPTCLSQLAQNNLAGASTLPINVPASEPPESTDEHSRVASNLPRPRVLWQQSEQGIPHCEMERAG